ncbi:MAG: hypothetical protein NVS1B13_15610 [Flavisolibacter sp.]
MNNIVLADDDPDLGQLFTIILNQVDGSKNLRIINEGGKLVDLLLKDIPDILFLDLHLPGKNGMACLHEIRENQQLKDMAVVVYSSSSYMNDIQRSFELNADLYLVKPFNSYHLKNALHSILNMQWRNTEHKQRFYFMNNRFVPFTTP